MERRINPFKLTVTNPPLPSGDVVIDHRGTGDTGQVVLHSTAGDGHVPAVGAGVVVGPFGRTIHHLTRTDEHVPATGSYLLWCAQCQDSDPDFFDASLATQDANTARLALSGASQALWGHDATQNPSWGSLAQGVVAVLEAAASFVIDPDNVEMSRHARQDLAAWARRELTWLWTVLRERRDLLRRRPEPQPAGPWTLVGMSDTTPLWRLSDIPANILGTCAGNLLDEDLTFEYRAARPSLLRVPAALSLHGAPLIGLYRSDEPVSDDDVALFPAALTLWQPQDTGPLACPGAALRAARDLHHRPT